MGLRTIIYYSPLRGLHYHTLNVDNPGYDMLCNSMHTFETVYSLLNCANPFKIHTLPVEDFGKVCPRGDVNFQMHNLLRDFQI